MAKEQSLEELKASRTSAHDESKLAKQELKGFCKSNKLDPEADHSADEKFGKKWTKLKSAADKKAKAYEDLKAKVETVKTGAKESKAPRPTKYEYPVNATADEKKKIRAAGRAAAKKAVKDAAKGEGKSSEKKGKKKSEETKVEEKSGDKKKKSGKDKGGEEKKGSSKKEKKAETEPATESKED